MANVDRYETLLSQLQTGTIKPKDIVGSGYKNGRKVAFEWLYTQILNSQLPADEEITDVFASASGMPFSSALKARNSDEYWQLENDQFNTFKGRAVQEYGIRAGVNGIGFLVWVKIGAKKHKTEREITYLLEPAMDEINDILAGAQR